MRSIDLSRIGNPLWRYNFVSLPPPDDPSFIKLWPWLLLPQSGIELVKLPGKGELEGRDMGGGGRSVTKVFGRGRERALSLSMCVYVSVCVCVCVCE